MAIATAPSRPQQALGITAEKRDRLLAQCPDDLIGLRDKVLVSVGFDTLCRRGELVALSVTDLTKRDDGRYSVLIRRAKNDPEGAGRTAHLSTRSSALVDDWLTAIGATRGPLLRPVYRSRALALSLRFHPHCYHVPEDGGSTQTLPAMVASVTDLNGKQTGAHRTWLASNGTDKASVDTPRRAMGDLLGHAVRFGAASNIAAAGEGIETVLSLRCVLPSMPMMAALSAANLAAILFPHALRRLYIIGDKDLAGEHASGRLADRARQAGIEAIVLSPTMGDLNDDLRQLGLFSSRAMIADQLKRCDRIRYLNQTA